MRVHLKTEIFQEIVTTLQEFLSGRANHHSLSLSMISMLGLMLSRTNKSLNFSLENCVIIGITYLVSNMPVSELQNIYAEIVRKLNF